MKVFLLIIIAILLYQSEDSRYFVSDQLQNASEYIRPEPKLRVRY